MAGRCAYFGFWTSVRYRLPGQGIIQRSCDHANAYIAGYESMLTKAELSPMGQTCLGRIALSAQRIGGQY